MKRGRKKKLHSGCQACFVTLLCSACAPLCPATFFLETRFSLPSCLNSLERLFTLQGCFFISLWWTMGGRKKTENVGIQPRFKVCCCCHRQPRTVCFTHVLWGNGIIDRASFVHPQHETKPEKKQPFQRLREARFSLDDPKACVCLKYHREANPLLKRKSASQMVDPNPLD